MPRLQFHLYVNVERRILTDEAGDPLGGDRLMEFFREEQGVLCFHCFKDDGSVWAFGVGDAFEFGVGNDWDQATAVQILSEDAQFNIGGDWASMDPTAGLLSCRYNTNTSQFNSLFSANAESAEVGLYLKQIDAVAGNVTLCQYAATARNIRRTDGTTPPGVQAPTYPTYAQVLVILSSLYQGAWLIGTTYTEGQTVTHEGGFFMARRTTVGDEPDITATTVDWALMAAPGDTDDYAERDSVSASGLTAGKVYRWDATLSSPGWVLADPDDAICETCELWLAISTTVLICQGLYTAAISGAVQGDALYLDDSGVITHTVPASPGDDGRVGRIIAWQRSATRIRFDGHVPGATFEAAVS